ncbi:MAG TPA: hypothetical protein VM734_19920 [Kofleriaceae bacterium]|nr:hypothetical protein [Kofleriaceae bacterium]
MRALPASSFLAAALSAALVTLTGCPGAKIPGQGGSKVDPNTCGNYATTDTGRKLKAFLSATVRLDQESQRIVNIVGESCAIMGRELQMAAGELEGQPKDVCDRVLARLNDDLKVAFKGSASLKVDYKPAVCKVDASVAARAAAQCEAKAEADVKVTCEGTCSGACDGTCKGSTGSGGQCNGVCQGSCQGSCDGTADVEASAQCKAEAEVNASVDVQCTEPELTVEAEASAIVDAAKAEHAIAAIKNGLPRILSVQARLRPLQAAAKTWARTAGELASEGRELAQSFQDQALCISGQIAAVGEAVGRINANISVSVEVSVSASASAGVK